MERDVGRQGWEEVRWALLRGAAQAVAILLGMVEVLRALLGALRFFLLSGASLTAIGHRRRWFEGTMLGRRMELKHFLAFGAWHADTLPKPWER